MCANIRKEEKTALTKNVQRTHLGHFSAAVVSHNCNLTLQAFVMINKHRNMLWLNSAIVTASIFSMHEI